MPNSDKMVKRVSCPDIGIMYRFDFILLSVASVVIFAFSETSSHKYFILLFAYLLVKSKFCIVLFFYIPCAKIFRLLFVLGLFRQLCFYSRYFGTSGTKLKLA